VPKTQTESSFPDSPRRSRPICRTTRDLTPAQRRLLEVMRDHQFGRVEYMPVQAGQPVFDDCVKIVRVARLGGESSGVNVPSAEEFELKGPVCELFDELDRLRDGVIVRLEFRHGLPFLLETTVAAAAQGPGGQAPGGQAPAMDDCAGRRLGRSAMNRGD
jgi:hypothetical protein